jgi:hypothetical protein
MHRHFKRGNFPVAPLRKFLRFVWRKKQRDFELGSRTQHLGAATLGLPIWFQATKRKSCGHAMSPAGKFRSELKNPHQPSFVKSLD